MTEVAEKEVLRAVELRQLSEDDLLELARSKGFHAPHHHKAEGLDKEAFIHDLVEHSYPVSPLPKVREDTRRGFTFRAFVDANGEPYPEGTDLKAVEATLVADFGMTEAAAKDTVYAYQRELVRNHGYTVVAKDGSRVVLKKREASSNGSQA